MSIQTEGEQHLVRRVESHGFRTNPVVFGVSAALILGFVLFGAGFPETAESVFGGIQTFITDDFGWFYSLVVTAFLIFVIWIAFSRHGKVRLGPDDAKPTYGYTAWIAMLFSAGMGIGVLFWSVAEPLNHFETPPVGEGSTPAAAREAMNVTFLHWGLHGWAVYAVVGLALAYTTFRMGLPLSMRSGLYPLLGKRVWGGWGHAIDTFAVLGTMFGVATTLGLGAQQASAGLQYLFGWSISTGLELWIIAIVTLMATASVVSGLDKGIKLLSTTALWAAVLIFSYVLLTGQTASALTATISNIGHYVQTLPDRSLRGSDTADSTWMANWTLFYWGWWLAWSPFVGIFIARISRGRTVREFILGVLFVPSAVTCIWYAVFGNMALQRVLGGEDGLLRAAVDNTPAAIFVFFETFPLSTLLSLVGLAVIAIFFVTSSDSASFVIDMLTAGGDLDPPKRQRVFWAVLEGVVAAVLLLAGGLLAMRTFQIATGLPLAIILIGMCVGLVRVLRTEGRPSDTVPDTPEDVVEATERTPATAAGN